MQSSAAPFERWVSELRDRFLRELRFSELRKGVVALSRVYVQERSRMEVTSGVFGGAGKRAAFACFYAPIHFMLVRRVVAELAPRPPNRILDLGCGTAPASSAWALHYEGRPSILGFERNRWAAAEARVTLRTLGLRGRILAAGLERARMPGKEEALVAAFAVNELAADARDALLTRLLDAGRRGAGVLVIEPIARRPTPWWPEWSRAFEEASGRSDTWRFDVDLPAFVAELDRASGLDHRELTARTLFLGS